MIYGRHGQSINMLKDNFYHDKSMFKGAPSSSFRKARRLRENMTQAEEILWKRISNKGVKGLKFRKQHPRHLFIVDFYCHKLGLIIEIDGEYHNDEEQKKLDKERGELLTFQDLNIIRFTNQEVYDNVDRVIELLEEKIDSLTPL